LHHSRFIKNKDCNNLPSLIGHAAYVVGPSRLILKK
jgi:hypothetical protein